MAVIRSSLPFVKEGKLHQEQSMSYLFSYFAILLPFGLLDAVWLSLMGPRLYRLWIGVELSPLN
jgi:hypothetical protein